MSSCPHFKICSGCSVDLTLRTPPLWNDILAFAKPWLTPQLNQLSSYHWRCRAKLAVRGTAGAPIIGLFKRGSHQAIAIPDCLVHHPHINSAIRSIRDWMTAHQIVPYDEKRGQGELRYLQLVVERSTGKVQVTFVVNGSHLKERWARLVALLEQESAESWHSLWLNFNASRTNTIFGHEWLKLSGEEWLWEKFGKTEICYQPATFGQANLNLFEKLLARIEAWVPPQAYLVEYFAGVGAIGLYLAPKCAKVICEEANPHAEACFRKACTRLPAVEASKVTYVNQPAEESLQLMEQATTLIVDPPRKGLTGLFKRALAASPATQLIYVSCGYLTFQRDCMELLQAGWELANLEGFAFFPGSDQIELLAHFRRK